MNYICECSITRSMICLYSYPKRLYDFLLDFDYQFSSACTC